MNMPRWQPCLKANTDFKPWKVTVSAVRLNLNDLRCTLIISLLTLIILERAGSTLGHVCLVMSIFSSSWITWKKVKVAKGAIIVGFFVDYALSQIWLWLFIWRGKKRERGIFLHLILCTGKESNKMQCKRTVLSQTPLSKFHTQSWGQNRSYSTELWVSAKDDQ